MDQLFLEAVPVLEAIEKAGYEAYFVGGSVRDSILGRPINDVDIASSATPMEIKRIFPKTADVGIEHGTVLVMTDSGTYEITTFRTEGTYTDFRRPDSVEFVRSLTEDLKRRDFTMNAIAMDKTGYKIDPFNGLSDIKAKRITTVGNPHERFHEDGLRMMRALRFVSQLGFALDRHTFESLKENGPILKKIAVERILSEFEKLWSGDECIKSFRLLIDSGLYQYLPGLEGQKGPLEKMAELPLDQLEAEELWTLLMIYTEPQDIERQLREWKLSVKVIRNIKKIHQLVIMDPSFEAESMSIFQAGESASVQAAKVKAVVNGRDAEAAKKAITDKWCSLVIKDMSELAVTGGDLLIWRKAKPGPWVKEYLEAIMKAVLKRELTNEKENIKRWLEECNLI